MRRFQPIKRLVHVSVNDVFQGVSIEFTQEQYKKLIKGHAAEVMEDKWNIIPKDHCLHLCRSWTGIEMYRVKLLREKGLHGNYKIKTFYVGLEHFYQLYKNKDDDHLPAYVEGSLYEILHLLSHYLLQEDTRPLLLRKYAAWEAPQALLRLWSNFGNLLFPDNNP